MVQAVALGASSHQLPVITGLSKPLIEEYLQLLREYDIPEHQGMLERIRRPLLSQEIATPEQKGGPA